MTTESNPPVDQSPDVDLDTFAAEFYGQNKADSEPASSGDDDDADVDADANEEAQIEDEDTLAEDEDADEDEDESEDSEAPEPKKLTRAEKRIKELNASFREEERKRLALEARIAEMENNSKQPEPPKPATTAGTGAPTPDDKNEDGTDKYPLGNFDPAFISDYVKYNISAEKAREAEESQYSSQKAALEQSWNAKLSTVKERYPDFREKGQELAESFAGVDEAYGEYLGATLMGMDYGPDVLYYLASNKEEAAKIIKSGPTKATIALGRIEARFAEAGEEKPTPRPKVTKAAPPPPTVKGSTAAKGRVAPDTEDLDAFSKSFFKR